MPGKRAAYAIGSVSGFSNRPLSLRFADTENFTSRPNRIMINADVVEIKQLNNPITIIITIRTESTLSPGSYVLLVIVTDGYVYRGLYVSLQINS